MIYAALAIFAILIFALSAKAVTRDESKYDELIMRKANKYTVAFPLLKAVVKVESDFNPQARNPLDPSYGLAQITPALAYDYGLIYDYRSPTEEDIKTIMQPENNIEVEAWNLKSLLSRLSFSGAVQAYNVGYTGFIRGRRNEDYYNKVMKYYEKYSKELSQ